MADLQVMLRIKADGSGATAFLQNAKGEIVEIGGRASGAPAQSWSELSEKVRREDEELRRVLKMSRQARRLWARLARAACPHEEFAGGLKALVRALRRAMGRGGDR